MAKTFIGELVLRLKNELGGRAKTAATDFEGRLIRSSGRRVGSTRRNGDGQFEERLRKLGASAT